MIANGTSIFNRNLAYGNLHDRYGILLYILLIGYAILGKGYAYLGVPPLFLGEIVLFLGLLVVLRSGCWIAMMASLPSMMLLISITWVFLRTVPYVNIYGLSAFRDSVVIGYGVFAFVVISILLDQPQRLVWVIAAYSGFAWFYGLIGGLLLNSTLMFGEVMPTWPGSGFPIIAVRPGECASHLAGAAVFAVLGLLRTGRVWAIVMLANVAIISVSRGAMLAFIVPTAIAAILAPQKHRIVNFFIVIIIIFWFAHMLDFNLPLSGGRSIGPQQIINAVESIVGTSDADNLDGTKKWRLNWWDAIVGYTINGPYFWSGKGFGINLAEADGFVVGLELGGAPVRSPHNVHMTILARSGVIGFVLWQATLAAWLGMLIRANVRARRLGDYRWANIFIWIACYGAAIVIDASFDVAMEGPMLGIWFWCLFGFGIAATMIFRAEVSRARYAP